MIGRRGKWRFQDSASQCKFSGCVQLPLLIICALILLPHIAVQHNRPILPKTTRPSKMPFLNALLQRHQRISCSAQRSRHPQRKRDIFHLRASTRDVHQDICVVNVDPEKLMAKLTERYGTAFEVHVRIVQSVKGSYRLTKDLQMIHNVYSIRASGSFSQVRALRIFQHIPVLLLILGV
jgi:hypothetical protein